MSDYAIRTWANRFNGRWVVIRERDGKVMTEGSVTTCLGWVATWGDVDLGQ
jgi:hypothetical protein